MQCLLDKGLQQRLYKKTDYMKLTHLTLILCPIVCSFKKNTRQVVPITYPRKHTKQSEGGGGGKREVEKKKNTFVGKNCFESLLRLHQEILYRFCGVKPPVREAFDL